MKTKALPKARIILTLHAHLPYIRIPDKKFPLQELWLYQSITECYIPLIHIFKELIDEGIDFKVTLSLSPTLLSMLWDDYYKNKYKDYLNSLLILATKFSPNSEENFEHSISTFRKKIQKISDFYENINGDIINELKKLYKDDRINLITTSATHAILPLFRFSDYFVRQQIETGIHEFGKSFGDKPSGFWLPEMAYFANIDYILKDYNLNYTFLDAHSVYLTKDDISYGNFYPSITENGVTIFPREMALSNVIWSSKIGYPGDYRYREFHYDYTYSLPGSELSKLGIDKIPFGLKVYRITGEDKPKEFYNYDNAMAAIEEHSDDFINKIEDRTDEIGSRINKIPVFTLPFDAELFGHWWHEGPEFLKKIIEKISTSNEIELASPTDPNINSEPEAITPAETSWGNEGFFKTWVHPESSWVYPVLADLQSRLIAIQKNDSNKKAIEQASREILLASSSDWTFFIANGNSKDYGLMRLKDHIDSAKKIILSIESGNIDEKFILKRESQYPIFNDTIKI